MIDTKAKGLKRADLETELELYREAGTQGVAKNEDLSNVKACVEEIERLQKEVGYPVKLTQGFTEENPTLAQYLVEQGAKEDDIVFAEEADLEEVAKIEAKIKADNEAAEVEAKRLQDEAEGKKGDEVKASAPDLVYNGKTVVNVVSAIVHGKTYKDVYVASGECFRITPEEFTKDVKERE